MNELSNTTVFIHKILRSAFGIVDNESMPNLEKEDLAAVEKTFIKQSIMPVALYGIEKMGKTNLFSQSLIDCKTKAIYDYVQRRESLKNIQFALEKEHIDYVPLKGSVLRDLYPQPWMRTSNDIDVLVREKDVERATNAIEKNSDFKKQYKGFHDVHFLNERLHLELHYNLLDDYQQIDSVLETAWDYAVSENGAERHIFVPDFHIFYIVAHACKHFLGSGGIGIRPLLDLWVLQRSLDYDENKVKEFCTRAGILGFYEMCEQLISVWFKNEGYSETTMSFEELVLSGGVFGSDYTTVLMRRRQNNGEKYAFSRLFVSRSRLEGLHPICKKHPVLVPVYQIKRWMRMLIPSKRKKIREELKLANSIEQKDIDKYEDLLKSMGL